MDAKDFALYDGAKTKIIKHVRAILPRIQITVLSNSLLVEPVYCADLTRLVVASQKCDVRRVLQLETKQKLKCLDRVETSIYEVAHEYISRVWDLTTLAEKFDQVMELPMDISAYRYRS